MSVQRVTGRFVTVSTTGERVRAYVPAPLPPDPPLALENADVDLLERANRALGRLDGLASLLPDSRLFLYQYVRKEALLSSQIEGTQSSLSDLLLFEDDQAPGVPLDDVREVSNYVAAMEHGLGRLRGGFPLSLRLVREIHGVLLRKGRGAAKAPGEFRTTQNWIAGSRPGNALFVPPPPERVLDCMGSWEKFLHDDPAPTPTLVKAALAHVQFETVHPFLDGNGRLGRLVITLLLCVERALAQPLLYLSLYFKTHRAEYYDWLQRVRIEGDWEGWLRFFLTGVLETADQATAAAKQLLALFEADRKRIAALRRAAASPLRIHELLQRRPLVSARRASEELGLTVPTVNAALESLVRLGIVRETTGKQRGRVFAYDGYLKVLQEGTEPLPDRTSFTHPETAR
ncbi:MAG: Fic family protein [Betaproteobacteria bacterium]|nr:Fic family protein [Betaproteobacteria bacterium]MDE2002912.1 Fic family protein [Betaproteobacteria bacterium]MDE2209479.1 Fic family protein [Betaproteobacteria bacterium]